MSPKQIHKDTLYCENPPTHFEGELYRFEIPETVFLRTSNLELSLQKHLRGEFADEHMMSLTQNKNQVDTEDISKNT